MRNVHEFDRKVDIRNVPPSTKNDAQIILQDNDFMSHFDGCAKSMLLMILSNDEDHKNLDPVNNCDARDLLVAVYHKMKQDNDTMPILVEQMDDMFRLGQCPQGRVIRLWQLYQSLL